MEEDDIGLDWLFSSEEVIENPKEQTLFNCFHDREEFGELDDFNAHNKEFHRRFKRRCKLCHNVFWDNNKLKTRMKKFHGNGEFACIHDGCSFPRGNGFHMHNSDCHKKCRQVCPHSKCLNVFNGNHSLHIHLNQQHPKAIHVIERPRNNNIDTVEACYVLDLG